MDTLFQDIRFATRQLMKSPAFALIAILTLGLGIGANTSIFSVVNGVLLKPLPFHEPDRVMRVWHVPPAKSFPGMTKFSVSPANYLDWEGQNHVFESMAIYGYRGFTLTGNDKPERINACAASSRFFQTLGAEPLLGRTFRPDEDQPGHSNVVVLSYRFWQEHFGGSRDVAGHDLMMDGQNFQIVGVMPANFMFPDFLQMQMWTPMAWTDEQRAVRGNHNYVVIARLKPGVDVSSAQAEMNTISSRLEQLYPADDKGWGAVVVPLHDDMVGDVRPAMLVLLGAVGCVLLIACVNVANLTLAKAFSREKEIAIRTALGASSARVMRQVLTESVLLALAGGALGLSVAGFGVRLTMAFLADRVPSSTVVRTDGTVLVFTAAISLLTGILAGALPALRLSRKNVSQSLKQGLGRTDRDATGHRTRSALVVSEVALSLVLLVAAGLMVRSFQRLHRVNPGFNSEGVLTANIAVSNKKFADPNQQFRFYEEVLRRARALPGVVQAGVADDIPLDGDGSNQPVAIEGRQVVPMSEQPEVDVRVISEGYMNAMHIPILHGRDFNESDINGRPGAILISKSMAEKFWPGENAIGKRLTMTFSPGMMREVVGIVGDVKMDSIDQTRPAVSLYMPLGQITVSSPSEFRSSSLMLVVRTGGSSAGLASEVSSLVYQVAPDVPVRSIQTMDDLVSASLSQPRFNTLLLGAFAVLALILAAIGIYSVLSYNVKRRVSEIGIRLALGARVPDVLRMVIVEAMKPTLLGLAIGAAVALAFGRVMSGLIYEIKPGDPFTFAAVAVLLSSVALFASIVPAFRASRVDPNVALRYE